MNQSLKVKFIKHTTNIFEKLGVASMAVGLFQDKLSGLIIGAALTITSYILISWENRL